MPYKSSTKDYSLGLIDRDIVKRYRLWLVEHFKNDFQYETNSIFTLGRLNDSNSYRASVIREFDLLSRVDKITFLPFSAEAAEESKIAPFGGTPGSNPGTPLKGNVQMMQLNISDMTGP